MIGRAVRRCLHLARLTAFATLAGCASLSAPRYHGPLSDHFDGKRFHNYVRFKDHQIDDAIRLELHTIGRTRGHWKRWEDVTTDVPPARVGGGALRVTFVNHSTVLIQTDSINILTDPVWSKRISPVGWYGPKRHRPPGVRFDDLPPIDVVLISHNHYDHMDVATLRRLVARFHPRIVTGLGNSKYLAEQHVPGAEDIDWWQTVTIGNLRITGVPAQHWSARSLSDKWRTLWLGFVVEAPSGGVYFAGDTGLGEFLDMIPKRFPQFRLAILPIAPARPRRAMAPRHMSAGDAVTAAQIIDASTTLAMHFGTFQQGDDGEEEPLDSLRAALTRAGSCAPRFWALRNGEARLVPAVSAAADSVPMRSCATGASAR